MSELKYWFDWMICSNGNFGCWALLILKELLLKVKSVIISLARI